MMDGMRPAAVAGTWYPGTAGALAREIDAYVADADVEAIAAPVRALVAPHAGLMYSGPVAAFAYKAARTTSYDAVVLVGPSHFVGFDGVSIWPAGAWQTPFGAVRVDEALAAAIARETPAIIERPAAHGREHCLEMQLPFVAHLMPATPIVPLVMGYQTRATAEALGDGLARAIGDTARVLLVASSDLSHYEDARVAARMDGVVADRVAALDPDGLMRALEREPRHACGGGPIVSVLRAASQLGASHASVLHYADSGDVTGDKSAVVGYLAAAIW
jgi:AmmeMemoRadiSam system protein B